LNRLKHPSLETAIYNNMGIPYLEKGDWTNAERSWRKALRIARENRFFWLEAVTKLNIADALAHSGRCQRARKVLAESKSFFVSVGDEEGMSMYHFNMALVCIEEGNKGKSIDHFHKYAEFPFTYIGKKLKLRQVMNERFREKGWHEPFPSITDEKPKK
jgi:tetratricopeptide (TPR) repeat protein